MSEANATDLAQRLQDVREALDGLLPVHKDQPERLRTIYAAYRVVDYTRTNAPKRVINDLISSLEELVKGGNMSNANLPANVTTLHEFGLAYLENFEAGGGRLDVDLAITTWQRTCTITSDDDANLPNILSNFGVALMMRFQEFGSPADLDAAILQTRRAVDITLDGSSGKPMYHNNLGNALELRFYEHGALADLEDSISQKRTAVGLTLDDHPNKPSRLTNLGRALEMRFEWNGLAADLEDAIQQLRKAVDLSPDSHSDKPGCLINLGNALVTRNSQYGSLADLEDAILQIRRAVDLTPNRHPTKHVFFSGLGDALESRFDRKNSFSDLEDAISQKWNAVNLVSDDHPNKPMYLHNLATGLAKLSNRTGSASALEDALLQSRMAVNLTPDDHPKKASRLGNLGDILETRFDRHGSLVDLDESVIHQWKALQLTPNSHTDRAARLLALSRVLKARFERVGDQSDLQYALSASQEATELPAVSSNIRIRTAILWARCCALESRSSLPAYECAIGLLPRIASLGLAVDDQYSLLAEIGFTVREAVEDAIAEGENAKAVEWAEQGRSIVWHNLLSLRTPLEGLRIQHPELARRLQELSRLLEKPAETRMVLEGSKSLDTTGIRMALAVERDTLIDEVRSKPGFEGFMKPMSIQQLTPAARGGAVVLVNLGENRCDALALLSDDNGAPRVVPILLERVTLQNAKQLSKKMVNLLSRTGIRARDIRKHRDHGASGDKNADFKGILKTLWLDYVQPILDGLKYQVNVESPPRLWWCTTGPLAFLPFHAAGLYDTKEVGHKLSDYAVSSYTPTFTALLDESSPSSSDEAKIVAVAISDTPGAPLPFTEEEAKKIRLFANNVPVVTLLNEDATQETVLRELATSSWAHLACHGEQVGGNPMESGLILQDGKLKLSEIIQTRLPNAEFAFLSACQTALGDEGVPEESAHLAAGMLFAGYRGVVATMWSIQDDIAPRVAEDFYRYMFRNGQPKREEAAYALHRAVRSLQESDVPIASWAPFIHAGR